MHDLNEINRLNAEAFAASIDSYRKQGRWVLAEYAGLTLVSIETFSDPSLAQAALASYSNRNDSTRAKLFYPVPSTSIAAYPPIDASMLRSAASPSIRDDFSGKYTTFRAVDLSGATELSPPALALVSRLPFAAATGEYFGEPKGATAVVNLDNTRNDDFDPKHG